MRELIASPAFLVFVLCTWPAVAAFHTHSGDVVADTLAWYAIGAYFVFPFSAIARVRSMRARGATAPSRVVEVFAELTAGWMVAWIPGLIYLGALRAVGAEFHWPDVLPILLQLLLRGTLAISLAMVVAAATNRLAMTVGVVLAFALAVWGVEILGQSPDQLLVYASSLAPEGMLRTLAEGRIRGDVIAVFVMTVATHVAIAVAWLQPDKDRGYRWSATVLILIASLGLTSLASELSFAWSVARTRAVAEPPLAVPGAVTWTFYVLFPLLSVGAWWAGRRRLFSTPRLSTHDP